VAAPEAVARRMVEFVGLNWAPEVLNFHKHARAVRSPSLWQVRQPLYDSAVGRWRNYAAHLETLRRALGDLAQPSPQRRSGDTAVLVPDSQENMTGSGFSLDEQDVNQLICSAPDDP
jgi:hypothetical protein